MKRTLIALIMLTIYLFNTIGEEPHPAGDIELHYEAVKSLDYDYVKRLLKSGYDINKKADGYKSLWLVALKTGDLEMLKIFLAYEPDLSLHYGKPIYSKCALTMVMDYRSFYGKNYFKEVELLLSAGADPDGVGAESGVPPLFHALNLSNYEVVELLLKYGAQVNISYGPAKTEAVEMLFYSPDEERGIAALKLLLAKGYKINNIEKHIDSAMMAGKNSLGRFLITIFKETMRENYENSFWKSYE